MSRISRISIKKCSKEDSYFMPLAEIGFYLDLHSFVYYDYINPYTNSVIEFIVTPSFNRNGDEKIMICQKIAERLGIQYNAATVLLTKSLPLFNSHIKENPDVQALFPRYDEIMRLANRNSFIPDNQISLNFMCYRQGVELHIRARTVESAKQQLLDYEEDGSVLEEYTKSSVQQICDQYRGLHLEENRTSNHPHKKWILYQELEGYHFKPYYFICLRDIVEALPLSHHNQYHEEPYYE